MNTRKFVLIASFLLLLGAPLRLSADAARSRVSALGYRPADPSAPVVTQKNLLASERFWPYRVSLTSAWQPPGGEKALPAREAGVLIRIEDSGLARVDYGGLGVHETPVERTDLLDGANRIRLGQQEKLAPNFVTALGPRLVDPASDKLHGLDPDDVVARPGFLCVFADPTAESFAALAKALAPLKDQRSVMTVFFPKGVVADGTIAKRLRALDWMVPFVLDHMSEGYTDSLVGAKAALPRVVLQTNEGRVLLESPWRPELAAQLTAKLEAAFGGPAAHTADTRPEPRPGS